MQLGARVKIILVYPFGYIFLLFFFNNAYSDRIDQYYQLYQTLEKYQQLLVEKFKDKNLTTDNYLANNQHEIQLEMSIKATSEFVTSCVMLTTLPKQPNKIAQGNVVLQAVITAYAMVISLAEFIRHKKEQKQLINNMLYVDMVIKYPHLVLIEYQLKIIKLLLEMNNSQSISERAFARIHLVVLVLPRPYDSMSKKIAKKIYKKYFNKHGALISLQESSQIKEDKKNLKKITVDWKELVVQAQRFSTENSLFDVSEYSYVLENSMNKKIMQMIEVARTKDIQKLYELKPNILEITLVEIYDFLVAQIER